MKPLLKIDITAIREQPGRILEITENLPLPPVAGVSFPQPVTVSARVSRTNQGYYVTGSTRGGYVVPCDRCLEMIQGFLEVDFADNFLSRRGREKESGEKVAGAEELDLTDTLMETITLSLPMKHLCVADCKGLCPVCGNNRNHRACRCREEEADPRLAGLAEWKKQQGGGADGQS